MSMRPFCFMVMPFGMNPRASFGTHETEPRSGTEGAVDFVIQGTSAHESRSQRPLTRTLPASVSSGHANAMTIARTAAAAT
jgi:hypothetical protein